MPPATRSRPSPSITRRSAKSVELGGDYGNLLTRDPDDHNLAMGVADDVLGDAPERALVRAVLVADAHYDQVGVFLPRDLDDSVAGLAGDVDLGARRDGMLRGDEGGGVEGTLNPRVLLGHDERRLERDLVHVDDHHLRLVSLVEPGGQLDRAYRRAEVEDRHQDFADRLHRPHAAGCAAGGRRWYAQHPAQGSGQPDREC